MRYCYLFVFFIWIGIGVGKPLEVEVSAKSAILMNAQTGAILYEKNARIPVYPASVTKIATALLVLEKKIPLETTATVSTESLKMKSLENASGAPAYWLESDGTMAGLVRGEKISFRTLLYALLLASGNDAANVLAESASGSIPSFMSEINLYLSNLGCLNTRFLNPHGLHHPEHFTTAYDLGVMAKRALQIPEFRQIVASLSYQDSKSGRREFKQNNKLLKPGRYHYSKAIGGKTGHTAAARDTLVAAAEQEGRVLIAVVLGCERKDSRYEDAIRLFETAFAEQKEKACLLSPGKIFSREIIGSKSPLKAVLEREIQIEFYPAEEPVCKAALHWKIPSLPIHKGQKVGEIQVHDQKGTLLQRGDLVAQEEVKATLLFTLKESLLKLFR